MLCTSASHAESWPPPLEPRDVPNDVFLDRAGFPELVLQNSILGAVAGFTLGASITNDGNALRIQATTLLGVGAGVLGPILLLRRKPIHAAQAQLYNFGERWGITTGLLVPALWNARDNRVYYGSIAGFFALGLGTGILLYPELELSPGQTSALGTGHTLGTIAGGLLLLAFNVVPDNRLATAAPVLFFGNAGMLAAYLLRDRFNIDRRRVIFTDLGAYAGTALGLGTGFLITGGDNIKNKPQLYGGTMLLGLIGGAVLGYVLSDELDEYKYSVDIAGVALEAPAPGLIAPASFDARPALGINVLQGRF